MRRVDFSTVINIIIANCRENMHTQRHGQAVYSQNDLVTDIFIDHYDSSDDNFYDSTSISRWIKGIRPVASAIVNYYREHGAENIADSFQENCLAVVFDKNNLFNELVTLVQNDFSLSEEKKTKLLPKNLSDCADNDFEICSFIGNVIFASIDRKFVPADKSMLPTSAIIVSEYVFGADVPAPCKYFCGRDNELTKLHNTLQKHSKVFISGFAGIGKSEFVKAYAKRFKKEYQNILYFNYFQLLRKS